MSTPEDATKRPQTVSLADEEGVKQVLVSAVFGLWEVVNNLTRLRPSKQERYRVTIFGSARAQPGSWVYDEVKRVAGALAEMGCDLVTGGGPGLMQAANEGAAQTNAPERNRSVGIRVELPFEQDVNPFVKQAFEHQTFFTRLHHFRHNLARPGTTVLICGYQSYGSLGRMLVDGKKVVTIMGEKIPVRAAVHTFGGLSGHAGQTDLLKWFDIVAPSRPRVILTHGEERAQLPFARLIKDRHGLRAERPALGEAIEES